MSTLRTNTLQTLDSSVTIDVENLVDINNAALFRQFESVADLTASGSQGRYDGEQVHLLGYFTSGPGIGGGKLYWDAASSASADNGTIFAVTGVVTGRWKRPIEGVVELEWFGIIGDGVTTEDAKVRAAIAATPTGGTLLMPSRQMTVLLDIPTGQGLWPAAAVFDKAMRVKGSWSCLFKLKDFTASYVTYAGVSNPGLSVFRIKSSGVDIGWINIDPNSDNHYETVGPDKVWEEGPGGKRPPNGFLVIPDIGAANIEDVKIHDCRVYRPLGGFVASGTLSLGGPSLDEPTFFTGQLATDTVVGCEFFNNTVELARGNDHIFVSGVRDSIIRNGYSLNSMYHQARIYAGCENCHIYDMDAYVDYTAIAARWNPTDNGYWRTSNPAGVGAAAYKIERSGYAIGSTSASTSANSGNIRRCSVRNSRIKYADNTSGSAIADFTQNTMASFFSWVVTNGIVFEGNESYNSPAHGLGAIISVTDPFNTTAQGIVFSNNTIVNAGRRAMHSIGAGFVFTENRFINCGTEGSGLSVCFVQGGAKVYRNSLVWQRSTANTLNLFEVIAYGPAGAVFLSDNIVQGYTGTRLLNAGAIVVHGTDGGGVPLTLLAGWAAGSEAPTIIVDCAGNVTVSGRINSAAGGTDTYASLNGTLAMYRPRTTVRYPTWQDSATPGVVLGSSTTAGSLTAARGALAAATPFAITARWNVDLRLP